MGKYQGVDVPFKILQSFYRGGIVPGAGSNNREKAKTIFSKQKLQVSFSVCGRA